MAGWQIIGNRYPFTYTKPPESFVLERTNHSKRITYVPRRTCHNTSYRLDESRFHCSECGFGCWVKDVADGRDKLPRYCPKCGRKVVDE